MPPPYIVSNNPDAGIINRINSATGTSTPYGGLRAPVVSKAPTAPSAVESGLPNFDAEIAALNRENQLLRQQRDALPKLLPFDYLGTQAKARQQAEGAVNPLYIKKFNDYIGQAKIAQERKVADTDKANTLLDENLKQIQETNAISGARTTEDTQNAVDQLNTAETNYQADSGLNFDRARLALARSGDLGSGLDAAAANEQAASENTQEGRQVKAISDQRLAQNRFKDRTLADLARSDDLASKSTQQSKEQTKLDLARYIQDYGAEEGKFGYYTKDKQQELEASRLGALASEESRQYKNLFDQFVGSLKGARGQDLALLKNLYGA